MPRILIISFLFFSFSAFAQPGLNQVDASGRKQGKWIKKDQHDKTIYEGNFKDGKPTGEFKYYYDTGDIKAISVFSAGGTITRTKYFFAGNILMAQGKYVNEKKDSLWKYYHDDKKLVSEETYLNGKKNGPEKIYGGNGKIVEEKNWKDSLQHGAWKQYYDDGNSKTEGNYISGLLEGEIKYYYPGNTIAVIGHYQHAFKQGKWTYYDNTGKIIVSVENYNQGDPDGYTAQWSEKDGTPKMKGEYKKGKKNGTWTYFDKKGKLEKDSTFLAGYIHGTCTEYFENGNKKHQSSYFYNNQVEEDTEWDESGKVVKTEKFDSVDEMKKKLFKKK